MWPSLEDQRPHTIFNNNKRWNLVITWWEELFWKILVREKFQFKAKITSRMDTTFQIYIYIYIYIYIVVYYKSKMPHFATCDQFYCAEIQGDFIVVIGIWWFCLTIVFIYDLNASHCVFCTFGCGLLFGLWSFLFFFSCSFAGCFSFFYLFIYFSNICLQASSAFNGVGIVKLMGRQSGFIAMYATIASGQVDIVLIPEVGKACLFCRHSFDEVTTVVVLCSFVTFCTTSW